MAGGGGGDGGIILCVFVRWKRTNAHGVSFCVYPFLESPGGYHFECFLFRRQGANAQGGIVLTRAPIILCLFALGASVCLKSGFL